MVSRFAKVSEEEIEEAFFYPSDLVNTKTTIPLRVGGEQWIYTSTLCVSVYIHHYSPPLRRLAISQFLMADISFNTACKELKIAQIAQLNQLFQPLHLPHIYGHGFF